ncbi:hypothetical protein Bpfe_002851 [Biomphalaria pfeifferi]|uniref:Peptidase S1 domain-containing protein n=1 Tax=Biomphalaria pfeifferi TaxID=112525 RepID=A0AAD8C9Q4_BIOPF|nr:hypothetical protein Bpfe_002851 [Biomphalaria pfeifferi]
MGVGHSIQEFVGSLDETEDSLIKANIVKQSQRTHEAEVSFGGEADLHRHKKNCKKDPSHKNFIPVNNFKISHLPWRYQYPEVFELIKTLSDLTVRVGVRYTSLERTEFYPDSAVPYPFYAYRGRVFMRTGTGSVTDVVKIVGSEDDACPCTECKASGNPKKSWCHFDILTATHVVYDSDEAVHAECKVDYVSDDSSDIVLTGVSADAEIESDKCRMVCVSHDLTLADKFTQLLDKFKDLCEKVHDKFNNNKGFETLVVVPSHPHGCPKQISIGKWTKRFDMVESYYTAFTYNASTCPGSSGAPLFIMARDVSWWPYTFIHSGSNLEGNHCGATWEA